MIRAVTRTTSLVRKFTPMVAAPRIAVPITSFLLDIGMETPKRTLATLDDFMSGTNAVYVEEMLREWKRDPTSVHASWNAYFTAAQNGVAEPFVPAPGVSTLNAGTIPAGAAGAAVVGGAGASQAVKLLRIIRAYQVRGHEIAKLDPLGLATTPVIDELDPANYGFTEADWDTPIHVPSDVYVSKIAGFSESGTTTLRETMERLNRVYASSIGYQYMHIGRRDMANWIRNRIEVDAAPLSLEEKLTIYKRISRAVRFESTLDTKFKEKRFGSDGAESMVAGLRALIDAGIEKGVRKVVIGMPHRGRLNVLTNICRKPLAAIFKEFLHISDEEEVKGDEESKEAEEEDEEFGAFGSGDVKYHMGASVSFEHKGRKVTCSLLANPSHLECVNPLVQGKVRCIQDIEGDEEGDGSMGVIMHGDAAIAGQGVVYESMQMQNLPHYKCGGTVHVVVNNQIGFTTDPIDSRSTRYCTDLGMTFRAPIFHVNADDVEAVHRVFTLAAKWRQDFNTDVIIDLVGYRRKGHNELDNPDFTNPEMYSKIHGKPDVLQIYREQLLAEGVDEAKLKEVDDQTTMLIEEAALAAPTFDYSKNEDGTPKGTWLDSNWKGFFHPSKTATPKVTGVSRDTLESVGKTLVTLPEGFEPNRNLVRTMKSRVKMMETGEGLDWGMCELLAYGTLLQEGTRVRLSGQDAQRGTFSHRHAVIHDRNKFNTHFPLKDLETKTGTVSVGNSLLSEFAAMGFELGYNQHSPYQLTIWEAQFGDFVNGAQTIVDNFLNSGEQKWNRQAGLVLLLPHGFEGAGPEHSSARIERFLQLSDEAEDEMPDKDRPIQSSNWQVVYPSTGAQFFHVLRRQIHRDFRKPLIVFTPKSMLRLHDAGCSLDDMAGDKVFQWLIPDSGAAVADEDVRRVVFCSGKVYYDLAACRRGDHSFGGGVNYEPTEEQLDASKNVAIVRIEQLSPFPFEQVAEELARYPNAEFVWAQEEPRNAGMWQHCRPRFETAAEHIGMDGFKLRYVGRKAAAAPATGSKSDHLAQQLGLVVDALE